MKLFRICEENVKEKTKVFFECRAKNAKLAIKIVANRQGNPHKTTEDLQFSTSRMYGTTGFLSGFLYESEDLFYTEGRN